MKQIYKTSDGREFTDEKSAELHEELVEAEHNFNQARKILARKLCETQFTADGFPFDFSQWTYYSVMGGILNRPYIQEISINPWKLSFDCRDFLEISYEDEKSGASRKIDFKDLYYKKENAEKRKKELLAEYIEDLKKEL